MAVDVCACFRCLYYLQHILVHHLVTLRYFQVPLKRDKKKTPKKHHPRTILFFFKLMNIRIFKNHCPSLVCTDHLMVRDVFSNALRPSPAICLRSSIFQVISQIFNEIWVWVLARSFKDYGTFLKLVQCWLGEMPRKTVLLRHKSLPQSEAFGSLTKEFAYLTPVIARQSSHVCLLCSTMLPPQVLKWGWCYMCDELRLITQMT